MKTIYVAKKHGPWHWGCNCTQLPHKIQRVAITEGVTASGNPRRPPSGELDNQCLAKEKHGTLVPFEDVPPTHGGGN